MVDVLVFGSANMDFISHVERLPKPGETIHGYKFCTGFGGKGANQCVAAKRLGAKAALIASLGTDTFGQNYMEKLKQEDINVDFVKQCSGENTGIAQIAVSSEGENHIVIIGGANNSLDGMHAVNSKPLFEVSKILLCQLETPVEGILIALTLFNGISILNAAPAIKNPPAELLRAATILCVNESEAALMCNMPEIQTLYQAKTAIEKLLEMGAEDVIITLGAKGAVYSAVSEQHRCIHVETRKVEPVVDTTGAGDAFLGALAFNLSKYPERDLHQHIGYANYVASYTVQFQGSQLSFPTANEIQHILPQTYPYKEL